MSHIDQAFINAYSDSEGSQGAPATLRMPTSPRHEAAPPSALRTLDRRPVGTQQSYRFDPERESASAGSVLQSAALRTDPELYSSPADQGSPDSDYREVELTLPPLGRDKRPLSAFAAPAPAPRTTFQPAFEVDAFVWPTVVSQLIADARQLFQPVVEMIHNNAQLGRTLVGLAGTGRQVGCTTVTLCLARLLAESGLRLAVVDANFANGQLASLLGVEFDQGWDQALAGNIPLAECAIQSLAEGIVLIPLTGPAPEVLARLAGIQTSVVAGVLRYHYDLVLFDLGAASDQEQVGAMAVLNEQCRLDAGIQIARSGATDAVTVQTLGQLGQLFGANNLGTIGNRAA